VVVGHESRAQQVEAVDALDRAHVGLLLDDVPVVIAPWCRAEAEPPRDMKTITDLADRIP
jgi:hypothetical protein